MTTLPTFAECAAVPPEKRTALQELIYYTGAFIEKLTVVIEEERARSTVQLEYSIQLQQLIEAHCRGDATLPHPHLYHHKKLITHQEERKERDALAAENERLLALLRDIETADKPPDADWCTPPWSDLCDRINAAIAKEPTT